MEKFKSKFTRIEGSFSQHRRLPRLGRIRLGVKVAKMTPKGEVTYPKEVAHFVVPEAIAAIYGNEPKELDVMLPSNDAEIIFPQSLAMYGANKGVKCRGNGVLAERRDEHGEWKERECPCEHLKSDKNPKGDCSPQAHLMVLLPKVGMGGVYQITTRSFNSVVDINSGIDMVRGLVGRINMIPLKLRREERTTHHEGSSQKHYTLTLTLDADIKGLNALIENNTRVLETARYQIEGPVEENPESEPVDEVEQDEATTVAHEPIKIEPLDGKVKPIRLSDVAQRPPAQEAAKPVPEQELGTGGKPRPKTPYDANWLSQVLDLQESLRNDEEGKKLLEQINGRFHLDAMNLPLDKDRAAYLKELELAHETVQA